MKQWQKELLIVKENSKKLEGKKDQQRKKKLIRQNNHQDETLTPTGLARASVGTAAAHGTFVREYEPWSVGLLYLSRNVTGGRLLLSGPQIDSSPPLPNYTTFVLMNQILSSEVTTLSPAPFFPSAQRPSGLLLLVVTGAAGEARLPLPLHQPSFPL